MRPYVRACFLCCTWKAQSPSDQTAENLQGSEGRPREAQIQAQVCALWEEVLCLWGRWVRGQPLNGCQVHSPTNPHPRQPGFLRRQGLHARKQSAETAERRHMQNYLLCVKKQRSGLIYMSLQCLYCRLIKPGLTETAIQVFVLWRDRRVTEETKNLQDLECMFGTVPAARKTSKWRLQGDRPLHLLITPTWAVEGPHRARMKQREKPSSHFFTPPV